jgi:hypothetical protein
MRRALEEEQSDPLREPGTIPTTGISSKYDVLTPTARPGPWLDELPTYRCLAARYWASNLEMIGLLRWISPRHLLVYFPQPRLRTR